MSLTVYLTAEEKKTLAALPAERTKGWKVEAETGSYEDSDEKRAIRMGLLHLEDPALKALQKKAGEAKTDKDFAALVKSMNIETSEDTDIAQILFAIGPATLTEVIGLLLLNAGTSDDDMETAGILSVARHFLFESFQAA
jgi:hypothetical protein